MDHSRNIFREGNQQNTGDENREGEIKSRRFKKGVGWGSKKKGCRRVNKNKGYMKKLYGNL